MSDFRVSNSIMDKIVEVGERIDTLDVHVDTVYADAQVWEGYRTEYNRLDVVLSNARTALTEYEAALLADPNVVDIMKRCATLRGKNKVFIDSDPTWAELQSLDDTIDQIITDGKRPFVHTIDKALNEKRAYLKWMAHPDRVVHKGAWERVCKVKG